jgi:hypothetical protein
MFTKKYDSYKLLLFCLLICNSLALETEGIKLEFREENNFYTIPIQIGSEEQSFEVQVDTTTSETWVPSINTTYNVNKFDPKSSKTCQVSNLQFEIDDEDGNVKGPSIYDSLTVGPYKLNKFGFVLVDSFQQDFKDFKQGKLGLGFRHEHGIDFNLLGTLKKNGLINKEMFTILPEENKLIIGSLPEELEGDKFTTCDLMETNDLDDVFRAGWVCELTHIFFGVDTKDKSLEMALQVDARVMFDSGYNYISMPKRHLDQFNKKFMQEFFNDSCIEVKDNNAIYFVCDDDEKIKQGSIAFLMGGYGYVIPWNKLFKKIEEDKYEMLIRFHKENDDIFIFGYPVLSQFVVVYNAEDKQLGFYGGEKIDLKKDWDEYMTGSLPTQRKEKIKKLLIYGGIFGGLLLLIIIGLVIRANKMKKQPHIENQGMINNEQNHI